MDAALGSGLPTFYEPIFWRKFILALLINKQEHTKLKKDVEKTLFLFAAISVSTVL